MKICIAVICTILLAAACSPDFDSSLIDNCHIVASEPSQLIAAPQADVERLFLLGIPPAATNVQDETAHDYWFSQADDKIMFCRVYETNGIIQLTQHWVFEYSNKGHIQINKGNVIWRPR